MRRFLIPAMLLIMLGACTLPPEELRDPYPAPNNVVTGLTQIWVEMDSDTYIQRVLYDSDEISSDGQAYDAFEYIFSEPVDGHGSSWSLGNEIAAAMAIMSGDGSDSGMPGVESIVLSFQGEDDWVAPEGNDVEGDPFPDGTLMRQYQTDMRINLKGNIEGSEVDFLEIDDSLIFYVIPVDGIDGQGYRLWKWLDLSSGLLATEDTTWTAFKTAW